MTARREELAQAALELQPTSASPLVSPLLSSLEPSALSLAEVESA